MRGAANSEKRRAIFDYHRKNADFLILQETHSTQECSNIWNSEWGGKGFYSHGTSNARGVAIFVQKQFVSKVTNVMTTNDGRVIILDITDNDTTISLAAIYAPNQDSPEFFVNLQTLMRERSEHKIILGDFNLVLDVELDRENTYCNNNRAMVQVENIMEDFSLKDVWRIHHEDVREFSWKKRGEYPVKASRIDFALVSAGLDQKVEMAQYLSSIKTDHRGLYLVVNLDPFERGRGYWKFNTTLLQDQSYLSMMNCEIIATINSASAKDPIERWEILKKRIKDRTIEFSREKVSEDQMVIGHLSEKVNDYEMKLPLDRQENDLMEATKAELEDKLFDRVKGVMFRSKARWFEEGERNTKYFYALEKAKYNEKTCYKLINEKQEQIENPMEILEEQRLFYENLYSQDVGVDFNMHNTFGVRVPEKLKIEQDQQLEINELQEAVKGMNNNKTPGADGLPADFYKVFWKDLKYAFLEMVHSVFQREKLHETARQGILNLIPKANKDTRYIKNLRPITLLNTDYKIIEKAIANKMLPALQHIIHTDQRGFMKNRRISVNIRKMLDIIHLAEAEDLEAVVLSLDFVKCFDKCSFSILHGSLNFFGFGEIVKEWTKILYKDFNVKVQNNGHFSKNIQVKKGVHQGGCCSSVYFLVIAEILALSLRHNSDIEGLTVKDIRNLLNQFADDMDVFSICKEKSIRAIYEELERFKWQSGFTVSYDKTTLYRIGSLRHSDAQLYNMTDYVWSNRDISVLGVTIAHEDIVSKNFDQLLVKAKQILDKWFNRGLSLIGKVQVVNTLVASLFVYKMMVLPSIPKVFVKNMENIIREYLWQGKKAKIALKVLQNSKKDGGLNLVNLTNKDKALKATWPQILYYEDEYAQLVYTILRCSTLKEGIWRCSINPTDVSKLGIKNKFWEDVLMAWCEYNFYIYRRVENQIIWFNSQIQIGKKLIFWKDVYDKGLLYVYQLFGDGKFKDAERIQEEFGLPLMRYNSLKAAIPVEWKDFFLTTPKSVFFPLPPHTYDLLVVGSLTNFSQKVYKYLADDILLIHNKFMAWRKELGPQYEGVLTEFAGAHNDIYSLTNITKFRSFQYRLLQRGLVTNIHLEKWGLLTHPNCSNCLLEPESISHLLYECREIKELWVNVLEYIQARFQVEIQVTIYNIVFNTIVNPKKHVANFLCLVTKQFIYAQRCLKRPIHYYILKAQFQKIESIEKYIAIKNRKLHLHNRKWKLPTDASTENISDFIVSYNAAHSPD